MSRRLDSGARLRRYLVGLAGALGAVLIGATAALAAVSSFSPSSGAVSPGESTTADFTVTPPTVLGVSSTSCISAAVSPNPLQFAVAFDGLGLGTLPANCAVGETDVEMTVTAGQNAAPGNYVVTVTEIELGGELVGTRQWPFTVLAPPTTTTTTTTTTTRPTTSTSTPTTSSTSGAANTTSTTAPVTTTTTAPRTTDSSTPGTDDETSPPTTSGGGPAPTGPTSSSPNTGSATSSTSPTTEDSHSDDDDSGGIVVGAPADPTGPGGGSGGSAAPAGDDGFLSNISLTDQLRNQIAQAIPLPIAQAVLSPLFIAEFLFRSVLGSAMGYLIPLLLAGGFGLWLVWRMRREVDDGELALSRESLV